MTTNPERFTAAMTQASAAVFRTAGDQRLAVSIYRLLAAGRPATVDAIALRSRSPAVDVEQRLAVWPAVVRNDGGVVVGFWGLAAEAVTGHQISFAGAGTAWAWCAYDTLFIPDLLDTAARVSSRCPVTGCAVTLTVSPDGVTDLEPAEAAISLLAAPEAPIGDDVRQTLCHYLRFFASPAAAEQWALDNQGTFWLPVADAFDVARRTNAAMFPALNAAQVRR